MPARHRNPGRRRVENPRADTRARHQVAEAGNHPVAVVAAVAGSRRPVAVGAEGSRRPVAVGAAGSRRPVAVGAEGNRRPVEVAVAAGGSCQEAAEAGSSPEEGVADQSCCLPGGFVCAYSGKQMVVMILSAIVCRLASHSGNRKPI
jgi:hypothetical protein